MRAFSGLIVIMKQGRKLKRHINGRDVPFTASACLCDVGSRGGSAWVTSEGSSSSLSLNAAESLQLFWLHRHLLAETNLASSAANERDTVGVQ